jgi:outer membrane murein-binding lipoprotein Lpp
MRLITRSRLNRAPALTRIRLNRVASHGAPILAMVPLEEALKAHDAWMEDVSQSLQEAHERCHQLSEDMADTREQVQAKLDTKVDMASLGDM